MIAARVVYRRVMRVVIVLGLLGFVLSCGGAPKPPETNVSTTPGQLVKGAQRCGATANETQMMNGEEVTKLTAGCKEAKASTASTEPLKSNTDATCQASLTNAGQTCVEPYPGMAKKWGVWDADRSKAADCYCAK